MDLKLIIQECKRGKTESFNYIINAFQDYIYAVVLRIIANNEEAKDITQDAFIKFWQNINRFDENLAIQPYLKKIAINLCYDQLKATERRLNRHTIHAKLGVEYLSTVEENYINQEQIILIKKLVEHLSPKQRIVFIMSDLEGNSISEISEMLNFSYEQVKSNLYYARKKIRESLIKINV